MKQLAFVLIVCMLLLAGCTQQTNQQTTQNEQQTVQSQNTAQPAEQPATTPGQPTTTIEEQTQPAQSPLEQLGNLLARPATIEYKAQYEVDAEETTQMLLYVKGTGDNQKLRVRSWVNGNEINAYMLGKNLYVCTSDPTTTSCYKMAKTEENDPSASLDLGFNKESLSLPSVKITPDGTYSVSGTVAPCFKIEKEGEPTQKVCVTADGAMAYYETTIDGKTTIVKALEYAKTVPDTDFELPVSAQITEISGMGQG